MTQAQLPYVLLYLGSTFLASVSQVLLKKRRCASTNPCWPNIPTGASSWGTGCSSAVRC